MSSMSKQDYETVAKCVRESLEPYLRLDPNGDVVAVLSNLANDLAEDFKHRSEAFDAHRFLDACGVPL